MSFHFEFAANREDARQIVGEECAPDCVKDFLLKALEAWGPDTMVHVKAAGHLFTGEKGNYEVSNANITVSKIELRKPNPPVTQAA